MAFIQAQLYEDKALFTNTHALFEASNASRKMLVAELDNLKNLLSEFKGASRGLIAAEEAKTDGFKDLRRTLPGRNDELQALKATSKQVTKNCEDPSPEQSPR